MASLWTVLSAIWAFIQAFATFIGLIKAAQSDADKAKSAEGQANTQAREQAVDRETSAQTEEEFDNAQSDIAKHVPHP